MIAAIANGLCMSRTGSHGGQTEGSFGSVVHYSGCMTMPSLTPSVGIPPVRRRGAAVIHPA